MNAKHARSIPRTFSGFSDECAETVTVLNVNSYYKLENQKRTREAAWGNPKPGHRKQTKNEGHNTIISSHNLLSCASTNNENDTKKDLQERLQIDTDLANSTREMKFEVAVEKADSLLRTSDIEEFANKTFKDLTKDQQAVMMLMVTKIMHRCNPERCPKVLVGALKPETEKYNAMISFVRKGEDRSSRSDKTLLDQ